MSSSQSVVPALPSVPPPATPSTSEAGSSGGEDSPIKSRNANRWFFDKARLENTPSRRAGVDSDKELTYRQQAANFIQDLGQTLKVNQLCINTAIVYMHRFYMFHSFTHFHRNAISTASIFLAAKVEEQPRKLEHVIRVAHHCLHRNEPAMDPKSEAYQKQSSELVMNENILLQTLGFDVAVDHPHTHVVKCCQLVRANLLFLASKDLGQTSYFMATNSLHLTTMCVQYRPTLVACVCIHLACKWSNWEIPRSKEGKDWWKYVDDLCTERELEELTNEYLTIFNKSPCRLKKKILSMNSASGGQLPASMLSHVEGTAGGSSAQRSRSRSPSPKRPRVAKPGEVHSSSGGMHPPVKSHGQMPPQHGVKAHPHGHHQTITKHPPPQMKPQHPMNMKPGHPPPPPQGIKDHRSIPPLLPPPTSTDLKEPLTKEPHHYHQNQPHPHPGHAKNPFYSQQQERERQRASHNNAQNHHSHSSSSQQQQQHSKPVVHPSSNSSSSSFANWNQQNQHHHGSTQPAPPPYKMPPAEQKPPPQPPPPSNKLMGQPQQNHGNHQSHSKPSNNYHSMPTGQLLFDPSNSSSSLLPLPVVGAGASVKEPLYNRPSSGSNNIKPVQQQQHTNNLNSGSSNSLAPTSSTFQFPTAASAATGGSVPAPQREKLENNPPRNVKPVIKPSKMDSRFGDSLAIKQEMKLDVVDPPFHTHSRTLPPQTLGMKEMGIRFDALDHESAVDISSFDGLGFGDLLGGGIVSSGSSMITTTPSVSLGVSNFPTFPTVVSPSVKVEKDAQSSSSGGGKHKKKKKEKHKDKDRERHKDEKKHKKDKHKDKDKDRKRKRDKDGVSPSTVLTPPSSGESHSERGNNMKIKILFSGDKGAVSVSSGNNKGSSKNSNLRS